MVGADLHYYYLQNNKIEPWCRQYLRSKKGLVMASLNINGLRSHIDEIKLLLDQLEIDILALNETKLDNSIDCQITDIAGFKQVRRDRSRHSEGVIFYVRDSMRFILRNDIPNSNLELLCIEVQPHKSKPFLLIGWYRPPNDSITTFHKLETLLSYLDKEGKEIILMGDTNCDLSKDSMDIPLNSNSRRIQKLYELFSLQQIIKEPTRVTITTSTLIDHIATSCIDNFLKAGVHNIPLSDHYLIFCMCKLNVSNASGNKTIRTRNMKEFNEEAFWLMLQKHLGKGSLAYQMTLIQWSTHGPTCFRLS